MAGLWGDKEKRDCNFPLISEFATYKGLESSRLSNLPVAHKLADSVICLPMYADLTD